MEVVNIGANAYEQTQTNNTQGSTANVAESTQITENTRLTNGNDKVETHPSTRVVGDTIDIWL